jgi:hypothetical protein
LIITPLKSFRDWRLDTGMDMAAQVGFDSLEHICRSDWELAVNRQLRLVPIEKAEGKEGKAVK